MNRRSDIYVFACSASHNVVPKDKWLAFVSTTVETSNPEAELAPGSATAKTGACVANRKHSLGKYGPSQDDWCHRPGRSMHAAQ